MGDFIEPVEVKIPNVRFGTTFLDVDYRDKAAKDEMMLNKRTGQIVYQRKDGSFLWFSRESIPTYEYFSQIKNKIIRTSTWRSPIENRAKFKESYFLSYITSVMDYKWDTELTDTAEEGEEVTPPANPAYVFGNKKINPEQIAYSISQEANGFFINLGITPRDRALIGVLTSAYNHAYANYDGEDEELKAKAEKFNEYNFMESHFTITYTVTWYDADGNVVDTETSEAHVCAGENSMVRFTKRYTYERATVNRTTLVIHDISAPKLAGGYELMHQSADTEEFLETVMDSPYIATDDMIVSYFFTQTDPDIHMADEASHTDYIFALGMDEYEATLSRAGYEIPTNGVTISVEEPTRSIWGNTQLWYETIRKVNDMDNIEFIGTGETTPEILEEMIKNVKRRRSYFTKDAGDVNGFLFKPVEGGSLRPIDPPITDKRFVDQFKIDLHANTAVVTTQNPATSKTLDLTLMPEDQTLVNLLVTKLQAVEELELSGVEIESLFVNPIFQMVQIGTARVRANIIFSTADEDEMNMIIDQLCKDFLEWIFVVPAPDPTTKHLDAFEVSYTQGEVEVTVEIPPIDEQTEEILSFTKILKIDNLTEDSQRVLTSLKIESAKIAVIDASDIITITYDAVDPVTLIDTGIIRVFTKSSITTPVMKIFVGQQPMAYRNLVNSVLRDLTEESPNEPDPIIPEKPKRLVTYNITTGDVSLEIEETAITKVIEAAKIPEDLLEKLNTLRQAVYTENYVDDATKVLVTRMELDAANETIRIYIEDTVEPIVDASYVDDIDRSSEVETIITAILAYEDPEEPWDFKDTGLDQYYIDLIASTIRISARGATIVRELNFSDLDKDSMTLVGELADQVCEASELITDACPLGKLLINPVFNAMRVVLAGETEANIFSLASHPAIADTVTKLTQALYYLLFPDERPIPVIDSYITTITTEQAIAVAAYAEEKLQDEWNFTPSDFSVDFQTQLTDLIDRIKMSEMLSLPEDANVTYFIIYSTRDIMDVFCDADDLTRYLPFGADENIQSAANAVRTEILAKVTTPTEPTDPDPETPEPTPGDPDPTP